MKYIKSILLLCVFFLFLRISLPFLDLYPYKLTNDYYLIGKGGNSYVLKKGLFGKVLVNNMTRNGEWIIKEKAIYGLKGNRNNFSDNYFYIERDIDSVYSFESLNSLNDFLFEKGIERYSMSDSENLVHLKLGNGRDRRFK